MSKVCQCNYGSLCKIIRGFNVRQCYLAEMTLEPTPSNKPEPPTGLLTIEALFSYVFNLII